MARFHILLVRFAALLLTLTCFNPAFAAAPSSDTYTAEEIVSAGHRFFGEISGSLATLVERAVSRYGLPNGYIIGQEGSGAFVGGLRYGDGVLYTKMEGRKQVFWQGPSIGWDVGGDGNRTMMLVYDLPAAEALFGEGLHTRFVGLNGSAYVVGGFGFTAAMYDEMVVVPIRTGVGARLGVNVGYLKFTLQPTWNPF